MMHKHRKFHRKSVYILKEKWVPFSQDWVTGERQQQWSEVPMDQACGRPQTQALQTLGRCRWRSSCRRRSEHSHCREVNLERKNIKERFSEQVPLTAPDNQPRWYCGGRVGTRPGEPSVGPGARGRVPPSLGRSWTRLLWEQQVPVLQAAQPLGPRGNPQSNSRCCLQRDSSRIYWNTGSQKVQAGHRQLLPQGIRTRVFCHRPVTRGTQTSGYMYIKKMCLIYS